ncbi:SGNH/GDSL hydrolase family protein [Patescibacteria group bacterium]
MRKKYGFLIGGLLLMILLIGVNFWVSSTKKESEEIVVDTTPSSLTNYEFIRKLNNKNTFKSSKHFGDYIADASVGEGAVLSAEDEKESTLNQESYTIAAIGDSMIETMGGNLEYLGDALKEKYPDTGFAFYNYGLGAENISQGLERFDDSYSYLSRNFPPLHELSPDVIIVGSYAYNPLVPHDRQKHSTELSSMVVKAKEITPNVYIMAEIAPLESGFGEGVGGVNWPESIANEHVKLIIEQLENAVALAPILEVGLIDVYNLSTRKESIYGEPFYVNQHDNIHPSVEGHIFTAKVIASNLYLP